ncbi:MAG TPA: TetR family transcriptional regulator [Nonomuraea sp.]|uniref:TetR/AcrR family transcriptional regulator n=1 Tax=Nonomuraea sp. NPDC049649 TaxID=3155776 RepID=UPI002C4C67BD|nr:TetR family transcriptional regulator [Nonomuraea sp.]
MRGQAHPRDREATRRRLLDAARALFAEHGYERVTVRMIAAEAEANIALVGRYFGSKAGLFGEVLRDEPTIRVILEGDRAGLPRRLAEYAARRMHSGPSSPILRALSHSADNPEVRELLRERLRTTVILPLAEYLGGGPEAMGRARAAAALITGVTNVRRALGPEAPTPADVDRLTAMFTVCLEV